MSQPSCGFGVRLTPRATRDEVRGVDEAGVLLVRVAAPPVEGAANEALTRLLARELGVPRSGVSLESGARGRRTRVRVPLGADAVRARWPGLVLGD
jgi:uncharacterized protein YggU (UPF0235/DUF167 family)